MVEHKILLVDDDRDLLEMLTAGYMSGTDSGLSVREVSGHVTEQGGVWTADDYLPKPFLPRELLLRVGAILHRTYPEPNRKVELAASTVDLEKAEVWKDGEQTPLTAKELQLFEKLYENAGRIVTTGILCETICGEFWQGYESTLSTHIRHLREKIEANPSKPVSLVTAKGLGYRLNLKGAKS